MYFHTKADFSYQGGFVALRFLSKEALGHWDLPTKAAWGIKIPHRGGFRVLRSPHHSGLG